jgi:hypothetical protein
MRSEVVFRVAVMWAFVVALAPAQYTVAASGSTYAALAGLPGTVTLNAVSNCDDCVESVNLSFPFPWFAGLRTVTQIGVASNGAIILDGSTQSPCCGPLHLTVGEPARISIAQADLDPGTRGTVYVRDTGASVTISFEGVQFYGAPASTVNAQAELFPTGDVEIRFGVMSPNGAVIATGLSETNGGSTLWVSPSSVLVNYSVTGRTPILPQNTGVRFVHVLPSFQLNSPQASLDIDAVQAASAYGPGAVTIACLGQVAALSGSSTLAGTFFDVAVSLGGLVPSAITTTNGQIVNLNPGTLFFLNSGTAIPALVPFSPFTAPLASASPTVASAQMAIVDPGHPDGFRLSQGVQLDVQSGSAGTRPGPTSDDGFMLVKFGTAPLCGPASVPFSGTAFTNLWIHTNGRLTFGGIDAHQPFPLFAGFTPFFGYWTDLDVSAGGTIDYTVTSTTITVNWNGVPHSGDTNANNLSLSIDSSGTCVINVAGIQANLPTAPAFPSGALLGLSGGVLSGATDLGPTTFTLGSGNNTATPSAMIYDFIAGPSGSFVGNPGGIGATGGFLPSVSNLQAGMGILTFVPGGAPGEYTWTGM